MSGYKDAVSVNSISHWLHDVSLFDSAWRKVSVGVWPWLWSHQLCTLTVSVWTPILAIEGSRRQIPYLWAYMLLGQVVAISTSAALFFAVLLSHQPITQYNPSHSSLMGLFISSVGGIITVIISPYVASTSLFMPNLLVMHILLILPLINNTTTKNGSMKTSLLIIMLYIYGAGSNLAIYVNQWLQCMTMLNDHSLFYQLIHTFYDHPAQSSISYDIVCMNVLSVAWMMVNMKHKYTLLIIILTPILSASVTLPLFFAMTEYTHLIQKIK